MKHLVRIIPVVLFFGCVLAGSAQTKAEADSAYLKEHYAEAAAIYEALLQHSENTAVYHNLGNTYFRLKQYPLAILNYERALRLAPADEDIKHSMRVANQKLQDKLPVKEDFVLTEWYHKLLFLTDVRGWQLFSLLALGLGLFGLLFYLLSAHLWRRKAGFFTAGFCLVALVAANLLAMQQKQRLTTHDDLLIVQPASIVATPSEKATEIIRLHEGVKLHITDRSIKDWYKVSLPDGREGWVRQTAVTII